MSGEVDGPWSEVKIHEVKGDATLQVAVDAIDRNLPSARFISSALANVQPRERAHLLADIHHLAPRILAIQLLIQRLITRLVMLDALLEVLLGLQRLLPIIVRVARRHLDGNVGGDDGRIGADRLDEQEAEVGLALDPVDEGLSTGAGRVRGI